LQRHSFRSVFEARTALAEQFKIGDVTNLESPFGELGHFLIQPFVVGHAMVGGNPRIVFRIANASKREEPNRIERSDQKEQL